MIAMLMRERMTAARQALLLNPIVASSCTHALRRAPVWKRVALLALAFMLILLLAIVPCACAGSGRSDAANAGGVVEREAVNDYSWEELSAISSEIAAAPSDGAALDVAKRYHLVSADGTLDGSQRKEVELANGARTHAIVVGFNHDVRSGGGKAGITFMFADAVAMHGMNNNAGFDETSLPDDFDAVGGWNACELRGWLNGTFAQELPADLQAALADVVKSSLVVPNREQGELDDAGALLVPIDSLVGQGVDRLWIPAVVELSGVDEKSKTAEDAPYWTAPLRAEGSQYQLFADMGVSEDAQNDILVRSLVGSEDAAQRWWLRSVEETTFAQVLENGRVDRRESSEIASAPLGIVPCFSI